MSIPLKAKKKKDKENGIPLEKVLARFKNHNMSINELLIFCSQYNCSDLYIRITEKPRITRYGKTYMVPCYTTTERMWSEWAAMAITEENNTTYLRNRMLDISYELYAIKQHDNQFPGGIKWVEIQHDTTMEPEIRLRYRVSCGFSMSHKMATFRMINPEIPSFSKLNFPHKIEQELLETSKRISGITMIVGPTGSGKSTTLAATINDFTVKNGTMDNSTIISLEDPIEYIHDTSKPSVNIIQKELGRDFKSFSMGIKQSLREHPNYIIIGETRDQETIKALVEASRSGHVVFTSFHASNVADTISRLYSALVKDDPEIMFDLITQMNMILCQRIKANGERFILETEYMVFTHDIINHINEEIYKGKNISMIIDPMMHDKKLLDAQLVKTWS